MAEDTSTLTDALAQILPNRHRPELLDAIDTLRHFNKKGLDLPVPQLVVLGDQSSGKSSVLESVARISLPVGTGLCTRFPIELALRNGSSDSMEMEILPGDSREQSDMSTHELKNFRRSATNLRNMDVSRWIQDAAVTIGVVPEHGSSERGGSRGYSDDVVRIVRRGPQMVDLTLIDLPGLFQSPTETQSAEDKSKVKKIILKYAENPNSLILLVCSAHNDFSVNGTPSVLRGRFRERTMGILTRSDSENGRERIMNLIQGEAKTHAELGWHFLINRSEEQRRNQLSFEQRDQNERDIFNAQLADIPEGMRGIGALRKRLGSYLAGYIRRYLPELICGAMDIEETRRIDLEKMPPPRGTELEQRNYLRIEAVKFVSLANAATYAHYSEHLSFFGDFDDQTGAHLGPDRKKTTKRRLQSTIRELNRIFAMEMKDQGPRIRASAMGMLDNGDNLSATSDGSSGESGLSAHAGSYESDIQAETNRPVDEDSRGAWNPAKINPWDTYLPGGLRPTYKASAACHMTMADYEKLIMGKQREWLGQGPRSEISTDLFLAIIYKQTAEWHQISETHLENVLQATRHFIEEALEHNLPKDIRLKAMRYIVSPRLHSLQKSARERLEELLDCHRKEAHAFLDALPTFAPSEEPTVPIPTSFISDYVSTLTGLVQSDELRNLFAKLGDGEHQGERPEEGRVALQIIESLLATQIPRPLLHVLKTVWNEAQSSQKEKIQMPGPEREAARRLIDHTDRFYKVSCTLFLLPYLACLTKLYPDDGLQFRRVRQCDDCERSDHEGPKGTNLHHGDCRRHVLE